MLEEVLTGIIFPATVFMMPRHHPENMKMVFSEQMLSK